MTYETPSPAMIRALQCKHGLTAKQCAEILQVSQSAYNHWVQGLRRMPAPMWTLFNLLLKELQT